MIPGNKFTETPVYGEFLYFHGDDYRPLEQKVMGGVALNDPTKGRLYKPWRVSYDSGSIYVFDGATVAMSLVANDVTSVSMAFDNNMSVTLAWTTSDGASLYYFDTTSEEYQTVFYPGITSCRLAVDDPRDFYESASDIIFGYTSMGALYYRMQRDRYDIPYKIADTDKFLRRMGPTTVSRLQFELVSKSILDG